MSFVPAEIDAIVHDYLSLEDLDSLEFPLTKPYLKQRAKYSLSWKPQKWVELAPTFDPIHHDMLTACILFKGMVPMLPPPVFSQLPPYLLTLCLVYGKDSGREYQQKCFDHADIASLPSACKQLFGTEYMDFTSAKAKVCVSHCAGDPELADLIVNNPHFNDTAANLHVSRFIEHHNIPVSLYIIEHFMMKTETLIQVLTTALEHKLDSVIDVILARVNPDCAPNKVQQVFIAAIKHHHKYIPELVAKNFHQGLAYEVLCESHMDNLVKLPSPYFTMILTSTGCDDFTTRYYVNQHYTNNEL